MDAEEQINKFFEFLDTFYKADILEKVRKDESFIIVDFEKLSSFSFELASELLDDPENIIKAGELAIEQFDLPKEKIRNFKIRFTNVTDTAKILIRNLRSKHLNKFILLKGVVRQKSDVRPKVNSAKYECPNCGNIMAKIQTDAIVEPTRCSCGRKGKFKLVYKDLVDAQGIVLEEIGEDLVGGAQPKRIKLFLHGDLVSPISEPKSNPGTKIKVVGILREVPIQLKTGSQSTQLDLIVEVNHLEPCEESFGEIIITPEEEVEIKEIAADPQVYDRLVKSLAPSIYGYNEIKLSILLQQVGGVRKVRSDGIVTRGDIHLLLVGDPGAGKSQLLKRTSVIAPKVRYVSGKGASGAGLTASVVKDEFLQGWSLEAGALVLASGGVCLIDEMDKMNKEDRDAMHEALEQQSVSISKANIQATLVCQTTVLAAANPKLGRFDPYDVLANQIDLPPSLINRFDLIFPIKDMPNEERDKILAGHILSYHIDPKKAEAPINTNILKKYIAYAKQKIVPVMSEEASIKLQEYFVKMRSSGNKEEKGVRTIPISARQLEGLIRLSEASAKIRLSPQVLKEDAERAIHLLMYYLTQVGMDPDTGQIDIDRISTGMSASQRSSIALVHEIINELTNKLGKTIPLENVIELAKKQNIDESKVEEVIEKMKRNGEIFEPKRGFISKI